MKTTPTQNLVRSTALALCAAGLALSGPSYLRAAEQATNPTTGTYGSGMNYQTTIERQSEAPLAVAAGVEKKDDKGFIEKMEQWQGKMTDKFRDAWKGLRGKKEERSIATASVDLREQKDSYTVRLNMPSRDLEKVEIKLDGDELHIVAPADDKAGRYEQTVALAGVAPDAKPQIERKQKDNLIVVTVPKSSSVAESGPSLTLPDPSLAPLSDWDRDIFDRMEKDASRDGSHLRGLVPGIPDVA